MDWKKVLILTLSEKKKQMDTDSKPSQTLLSLTTWAR